jgi:hypothetical protein
MKDISDHTFTILFRTFGSKVESSWKKAKDIYMETQLELRRDCEHILNSPVK